MNCAVTSSSSSAADSTFMRCSVNSLVHASIMDNFRTPDLIGVSDSSCSSSAGNDDDTSSSGVVSVKSFVASFENQYRQQEAKPPGTWRGGDTAWRPTPAPRPSLHQTRFAHTRGTSIDLTYSNSDGNGCTDKRHSTDVVASEGQNSSTLSTKETSPDVGNVFKPFRRKTEAIGSDVQWRTFSDAGKIHALGNSLDNLCDSTSSSLSPDVDVKTDSRAFANCADLTGAKTVRKKPSPQVLPKPSVKRLPNGQLLVQKFPRSQSLSSGCILVDGKEGNELADAQNKTGGNQDLSDNTISGSNDVIEPSSPATSCDNFETSPPCSSSQPPTLTTLSSRPESFNGDVTATVEGNLPAVVCPTGTNADIEPLKFASSSTNRHSRDSSRTSSSVSVFGSTVGESPSIDIEDQPTSPGSFGSKLADSGIVICESSRNTSLGSIHDLQTRTGNHRANSCSDDEGVKTTGSSGSAVVDPGRVSALLLSACGQSSSVLCQIICDWSVYLTALDYVSDLFSEEYSSIRRYHDDLSLLCEQAADGCTRVQYLSVEALKSAFGSKLADKRLQLQNAQLSVEVDLNAVKLQEKKILAAVKTKAISSTLSDKLSSYFGDMDKAMQLLLMLSSRLSRIDNELRLKASSNTPDDRQSVALSARREELVKKLEDARQLKIDICSRGVSEMVIAVLTDVEQREFTKLVSDRNRLALQKQEVVDWIKLTDEHSKLLANGTEVCGLSTDVSLC